MTGDTSTPAGRFTLTVMAANAQLEREMALVRTMSGLQRAKERGVILGTVKRFTDQAIAEAVEMEGTYEAAAKSLGCSRITIIRGMDRIKAARAAKEKSE